MIVYPNAKINLGLNIIARRSDGFHDIESCFLPVEYADRLELSITEEQTKMIVEGIHIPGDSRDNLCIKAWELLHEQYQIDPVRILLHKKIPIGAGLGGGSSDAAFMLKALNTYYNLNIPDKKLMSFAAKLGSDCSFFIRNNTAIARGRGEILEPINLNLGSYKLILINPGLHISTAEAYAGVRPGIPVESIENILSDSIETWEGRLVNDFEVSIFERYPLLREIKKNLYDLGAVYASMSGSGSTIFGLFYEYLPDGNQVDIMKEKYHWIETSVHL